MERRYLKGLIGFAALALLTSGSPGSAQRLQRISLGLQTPVYTLSLNGSMNKIPVFQIQPAGLKGNGPFTLVCGLTSDSPLIEWIEQSWKSAYARKDGTVNVAQGSTPQRRLKIPGVPSRPRLSFSNGLITEIGFPALGAAQRGAATLSIKIETDSAVLTNAAAPEPAWSGRLWTPRTFQVTLGTMVCKEIQSVDSITLQRKSTSPETLKLTVARSEFLKSWPVKWAGPDFDASTSRAMHGWLGAVDCIDDRGKKFLSLFFTVDHVGRVKRIDDKRVSVELSIREASIRGN